MSHSNSPVTTFLALISRLMAVVAMALVCAALFFKQAGNAKMEASIESSRAQMTHTNDAIAQSELQLSRKQNQVQIITKDIARQIEEKQQLRLTMADVLSRAKALQQERDHFGDVQQEVLKRFAQMDKDYVRTGSAGVGVQPK